MLAGNDAMTDEASTAQAPVTMDEDVTHATLPGVQRYGFTIGEWRFLFPGDCPGEVVVTPEISAIPHTRHWMLGVMVLRGNLIPVFDLYSLLLDTPLDLNKSMVLILGQGKQALGFVVQEPPRWLTGLAVASSSEGNVPPLLAAQRHEVFRQREATWIDFNKTELFTFLAESAKSC